ncbi:MAG: family 10 glycosylhydrolase [Cyanobacteria bacterium J06635_15]
MVKGHQKAGLRQLWIRSFVLFLLTFAIAIGSNLHWPVIAQTEETPTIPGDVHFDEDSPPILQPNQPSPSESPNLDPSLFELLPPPRLRDIDNHWAKDCIQGLVDQNRLGNPNTYPDGQFRPDDPTTWQDLITWLNPDSLSLANSAANALGITNPSNFLSHYPANYFELDQALSRVEVMMAIAAKRDFPYVNNAIAALKANFADATVIPEFAREGVAATLAQSALVLYPPSDRLDPNQIATRGEVAAMVCQATPIAALTNSLPSEAVRIPQTAGAPAIPDQELRGVWLTNIDSEVLFSRENLEQGIATLKEANFNTVYPTVWNWGTTLYPSAAAERTIGVKQGLYPYPERSQRDRELEATQGDRDMLEELIEIGHGQGLKVIPWFEFGYMTPSNSSLVERHPDWLTHKADGTYVTPAGDFNRAWLNPFHPQVQRFFLLMVDELLRNYDIDGFQVDDHMGIPVEFGYDPVTIALYQQEHDGQSPPVNPNNREWVRWRADKISDFMGEIAQLIKNRRPDAILSVSPNPHPFAYDNYLQDWPTWVNRGYVDELIIQVYRRDMERFIWEMNKPWAQSARRRIPTSLGILTGLRTSPMPIETVQQQIDAVRDRAYAGVSFFFFESLFNYNDEPADARLDAIKSAFPNLATIPNRESGWRSRNPL